MNNKIEMSKDTYVINVIGGPGIGKTTISALLFANLKLAGFVCEYVQEYAKKLVWTKDFDTLNNQYWVSREQYRLLNEINGHVDFIVTDGPLIHGIYYNKYNKNNTSNVDKTEKYILESINRFKNINIVLERVDREYEVEGRIETKEQAQDIDLILRHILRVNGFTFHSFQANPNQIDKIVLCIRELSNYEKH